MKMINDWALKTFVGICIITFGIYMFYKPKKQSNTHIYKTQTNEYVVMRDGLYLQPQITCYGCLMTRVDSLRIHYYYPMDTVFLKPYWGYKNLGDAQQSLRARLIRDSIKVINDRYADSIKVINDIKRDSIHKLQIKITLVQ